MQGELTKSDFAKLAGVTPGRISQLLRDGVISRSALAGDGRNAKIKADLALAMMRDRQDPAKRANTDDAGSTYLANRARREGYQADLLAIRLGQGRRQLEEEYKVAWHALIEAIKRAFKTIPFRVEEIIEAWQTGGLPAAYARSRAHTDELLNTVADLMAADLDEHAPERDDDR
jgi:hypothetical protein